MNNQETDYNYFDFIMQWHPDYYHSDDVLLSDDCSKALDGEELSECCIENLAYHGITDLNDTQALVDLQCEVDAKLFKEALAEYLQHEYISEERK